MTTIRTADGWRYTLSANDFLWLGRAANAEGGSRPAVIWTYLQRYAQPMWHQRYRTLASMVLAHSQPINPRWRRDGDMCSPSSSHAGQERCSERRFVQRDGHATRDPSQFRAVTKDAMAKLRVGTLDNPVPRAVDFASYNISSFLRGHAGWRKIGQFSDNWHVASPTTLRWPDNFVRIDSGAGSLGLALLGVAALGAGWLWWRRRARLLP